ncbi:MAG: ABC transporter ATP-binding protein/permease [Cyclobacteriaceae bacterium]|nr:ABC transporter ATP-binding protein/permease [Cyclobacteriaceae bacterium]
MNTYLRIISYAKGLGWYIPQYVISVLLYSLFSVFNIALMAPMFEVLFQEGSVVDAVLSKPAFSLDVTYFIDLFDYYSYQIMVEHGKMGVLKFVGLALVVAAFFSNIFRYITTVLLAIIRTRVIQGIRIDVFDKVTGLDIGYFTNERKGDIMSRITNDVQQVEHTVQDSLKIVLLEPIQLIFYFVALYVISPSLMLYTLILLPLSGGLIAAIAKRLKKSAARTQSSMGNISYHVEEAISGIRLIKAFTARGYITQKFKKEVANYSRLSISMAKKFDLASPISEFMGIMIVAGLLIIGGSMVLSDNAVLTGTGFMTFILLFARVLQPAKAISNSLSSIQRGLASADRIFEITDTKPLITENEEGKVVEEFKSGISFKNVSFKYEDEYVLKNISFELEKGKTIALVGMSGGGKSTIADLVPRFYDPTEGEITIDGNDLRKCTLNSIRKKMGIVTQESILFNDTILSNIAFGIENPSEEEVVKAAKIANAHEFILNTPSGYQTVIGEDGAKLSGGQRQRLSIARAVMKNPDILILDEATSALDSHSERQVQEAITNLMSNRTSLVIAHRLSTIQHADEILVIERGEIIERGSHVYLMQKGGKYKSLQDMQNIK